MAKERSLYRNTLMPRVRARSSLRRMAPKQRPIHERRHRAQISTVTERQTRVREDQAMGPRIGTTPVPGQQMGGFPATRRPGVRLLGLSNSKPRRRIIPGKPSSPTGKKKVSGGTLKKIPPPPPASTTAVTADGTVATQKGGL